MTAKSLRRHSGSGLSGRPPSEPFSSLKRATRCIISSRLQFRISFQSLIAFPPYVSIVLRRRKHADTAARRCITLGKLRNFQPAQDRQRDRLPRRLQLADLGSAGDGAVRKELARRAADADTEL